MLQVRKFIVCERGTTILVEGRVSDGVFDGYGEKVRVLQEV